MSNQELSIEELTERFYTVRGQRNGLIAVIQKIRPFIYAFQRGEATADTCLRAIETLCNDAVKIIHPGITEEATNATN